MCSGLLCAVCDPAHALTRASPCSQHPIPCCESFYCSASLARGISGCRGTTGLGGNENPEQLFLFICQEVRAAGSAPRAMTFLGKGMAGRESLPGQTPVLAGGLRKVAVPALCQVPLLELGVPACWSREPGSASDKSGFCIRINLCQSVKEQRGERSRPVP